MERWLDALEGTVEGWIAERADATQDRLRERYSHEEAHLAQLAKEQNALAWFKTMLVILPFDDAQHERGKQFL